MWCASLAAADVAHSSRWNFSVGEHELSYVTQSKHTRPDALTDESAGEDDVWLEEEIDEDNITHEEDDDDVTVDSCAPEGRPCGVVYNSWLKLGLVQLVM